MQIVSFSDNALGGSIKMAIALGSSVALYRYDSYSPCGWGLLPGMDMPEEVNAEDTSKIHKIVFCENPIINQELIIGDLSKLSQLEEVEFWYEIPEAFVIELKQALPRLKIDYCPQ